MLRNERVAVSSEESVQLTSTREAEQQKRQIVTLRCPCAELMNGVEHALEQFAWREFAVGPHTSQQPLFSKFLSIRVSRFRYPVAVSHKQIARLQLQSTAIE